MNRETKAYFRTLFESQIAKNDRVQLNLKEVLNDMSETPADHLDFATALTTNTVRFKLSLREAQLIQSAKNALRKLDRGQFGICENCDEEIGLGRLRVTPTAAFCLDCQIQEEKEQKKERSLPPLIRR